MLYISKRKVNNFFALAVCIMLYVIGSCIIFSYQFEACIYCVAHAILAIITTNSVLFTIESTEERKGSAISLGGLSLYTLNTYFILSAIKYGAETTYTEYVSDNSIRFLGTVICFLSLELVNSFLKKAQKKQYRISDYYDHIEFQRSPLGSLISMLVICVILLYSSIAQGSYYNTTRIWNTPKEAFFAIVEDVICYLVVAMAINNIKKKRLLTYCPIALYIICVFACAVISGSRTSFVRPIIVVIYALIALRKMNVDKLRTITCIMPFGILLFTTVLFSVSNRFADVGITLISKNIGYRFDLSDLSMTFMERTGYIKLNFSTLCDGILQAIPSAFLPSGFKENLTAYTDMLTNNGLIAWKDYTDTYLSMGTEMFGIIGMILLPIVFVLLFERIDSYAMKKHAQGLLLRVSIAGWAATIERAWLEMMPLLRNLLIYIVLALLVERMFIKYTRRHIGDERIQD